MIAADLADIIGRPYVVELLDALSGGPRRPAELATVASTSKRNVRRALRMLASAGLIRGAGTFDLLRRMPLTLTSRGAALVNELTKLETWTALYND